MFLILYENKKGYLPCEVDSLFDTFIFEL